MAHRTDTIVEALRSLGGQAKPAQIAKEIRRLFPGPHPRALLNSVRARLQEQSSDSKTFRGKRDIFYSVHGIGNGVWGLRDGEPTVSRTLTLSTLADAGDEDLIRLAWAPRTRRLGTQQEINQRRVLLNQLHALTRAIEAVRPQLGMLGHNRPPERLEWDLSALTKEILEANSAISGELHKETPNIARVATQTTRLRRIISLIDGAKKSARSIGELVTAKTKEKVADVAVMAEASIALFFGEKILDMLTGVVSESLRWLSLVLS